jgi:hypothetical protein
MGKMKQEFEKFYNENPDMSDAEYQDWLYSQGYKPVTMEETQAQHDAWWNSLTEEEKQKIADEAQTVSTYFDEQRADRDE